MVNERKMGMFTKGEYVVVESKIGFVKVFNLCMITKVDSNGIVIGKTQFDANGNQRSKVRLHKAFLPDAEYTTTQTAMQALTECAAEIGEETRLAAIRHL